MKKIICLTTSFSLTTIGASHAWALGLGELTLYSHLNEPFKAEIALLEAASLRDGDVQVSLAPAAEFARFGMSRELFLTRISFVVESDDAGKHVVLSTEAPLREPYLDFIVEARWPDGRLLREYTVLVDLPPRMAKVPASTDDQTVASDTDGANETVVVESVAREYDSGVLAQPKAGSRYLVAPSDTLWRIAAAVAGEGVSIEQIMLEIVTANPQAFQGGNVNGLKSGYVLQLPGAGASGVDEADAKAEVALQHEEWASDFSRAGRGLTLVADTESDSLGDAVNPDGMSGTDGPPLSAEDPMSAAFDDSPADDVDETQLASQASEIDALVVTVGRLEDSVARLQEQLSERDAEIAALRAALSEQKTRSAQTVAPLVVESTDSGVQPRPVLPFPLWAIVGAVATLMTGLVSLIWIRRRHHKAEQIRDPGADHTERTQTTTPTSEGRLSDPQIMASKVVEEAEIYIAYGRTDQAVEVLKDALAQGLSSPSLYSCLMECYVESEQVTEATDLLAQLEAEADPELAARARRLLQDSGLLSRQGAAEVTTAHSSEVEASSEPSVLSEFSFSTDPDFHHGTDDGSDIESDESDIVSIEVDHDSVDDTARDERASDIGAASVTKQLGPRDIVAEDQAGAALEVDVGDVDRGDAVTSDFVVDLDPAVNVETAPEEPLDELATHSADEGSSNPESSPASVLFEGAPDKAAHKAETVVTNASGLTLAPLEDLDAINAEREDDRQEASIYGAETDPVDSKLDLARAYIDMGDEDGARPVLLEVIKQGDLGQQAEARELLLRIEAT